MVEDSAPPPPRNTRPAPGWCSRRVHTTIYWPKIRCFRPYAGPGMLGPPLRAEISCFQNLVQQWGIRWSAKHILHGLL